VRAKTVFDDSDASDDETPGRVGFLSLEERETGRVLEDLADALACPRGTLEVLLCADSLGDDCSLLCYTESRPNEGGKDEGKKRWLDQFNDARGRTAMDNAPPLRLWAVARACGVPPSLSGHRASPSCSRRAPRGGSGRSASLRNATMK